MFNVVSGFMHVFISLGLLVALLGPHVVLAAWLFIFWQWHLRLFKIGGFCLSLLQWGALILHELLLDVFVWTLLQRLHHLWLVLWVLLMVLVNIFKWGCLLLMVLKQGAVVVNGLERCSPFCRK